MRKYYWLIILGLTLLALCGIGYYIHYLIFHDVHHIFIYFFGDLAFLPLEVLIVVVVIERLLAGREKQTMLHKLNMVIGAFFSEVGNGLIHDLLPCFDKKQQICEAFAVKQEWRHKDFKLAMNCVGDINARPDFDCVKWDELKEFLVGKRAFLLGLLENPNLLEHERFTDLLWATFHLTEELEARPSFDNLPEHDREHLCIDVQRIYNYLTREWIYYVEHLKNSYPFLYSLVVRTHPFLEHPSAVIQ
jgi:hypothetical protein